MIQAPAENRQSQRRSKPRDDGPQKGMRRFLKKLGPGIVTGAADDDPSGIATYSIAGAQHGMSLLWMALYSWPLMLAVQDMCARIGMVTGRGLAGALRQKFPRSLVLLFAVALFIANTINVGADLSGMADAAELLTGINSHIWVVVISVLIGFATVALSYKTIANTLKWLAAALFAYVITALLIGPDWDVVAQHTLVPVIPRRAGAWATVVAILGTTISPYLFFWQASQEVEEEKSLGRRRIADRVGAAEQEITTRKVDVTIGTFFSNTVMFFIILATALTLYRGGMSQIDTSREVAEALAPLAGRFAALLYTVGIVGVGALAIPTLSGSAAYALAEVFGWRQGIGEKYRNARAFYISFFVSIAIGAALDFASVNAIGALYWSAVINGLLAPFLLVSIVILASDKKLMHGQPSSWLGKVVVTITALLMFGAAVGMFLTAA